MRIIAGRKRGKKIIAKCDEDTRPTTDRVRENVFNILSNFVNLNGARVLDLFAGCGTYGLESHSRGASEIVFNDVDITATEIIKKNCKLVGCAGAVINLDFRAALEKIGTREFDIIFIDPPYSSEFAHIAVDIIAKQKMLSKDGIIIVETQTDNLHFPTLSILKQKSYGRAKLYFLCQHLPIHEQMTIAQDKKMPDNTKQNNTENKV